MGQTDDTMYQLTIIGAVLGLLVCVFCCGASVGIIFVYRYKYKIKSPAESKQVALPGGNPTDNVYRSNSTESTISISISPTPGTETFSHYVEEHDGMHVTGAVLNMKRDGKGQQSDDLQGLYIDDHVDNFVAGPGHSISEDEEREDTLDGVCGDVNAEGSTE